MCALRCARGVCAADETLNTQCVAACLPLTSNNFNVDEAPNAPKATLMARIKEASACLNNCGKADACAKCNTGCQTEQRDCENKWCPGTTIQTGCVVCQRIVATCQRRCDFSVCNTEIRVNCRLCGFQCAPGPVKELAVLSAAAMADSNRIENACLDKCDEKTTCGQSLTAGTPTPPVLAATCETYENMCTRFELQRQDCEKNTTKHPARCSLWDAQLPICQEASAVFCDESTPTACRKCIPAYFRTIAAIAPTVPEGGQLPLYELHAARDTLDTCRGTNCPSPSTSTPARVVPSTNPRLIATFRSTSGSEETTATPMNDDSAPAKDNQAGTNDTTTGQSNTSDDGDSGGGPATVIIAALVVVLVIACVIAALIWSKKRSQAANGTANDADAAPVAVINAAYAGPDNGLAPDNIPGTGKIIK